MAPTFALERQALDRGESPVAGVDEVGRGPLAGPVIAAAVILDPDRIPDGLADSKRLSERHRDHLFEAIFNSALAVSVAGLPPALIDRINIRQATLQAMSLAIHGLAVRPGLVLVDGKDCPVCADTIKARAIVSGDAKVASIAAASIIAKVTRDRMLHAIDREDDRYGFARHKGYGSAFHRDAITRIGPTRHHRMTFGPTLKAHEARR